MTKNRVILKKTKSSDCNFKKSIRYKKSKSELDIISSQNFNKTCSYIVSSAKKIKRVLVQKF